MKSVCWLSALDTRDMSSLEMRLRIILSNYIVSGYKDKEKLRPQAWQYQVIKTKKN